MKFLPPLSLWTLLVQKIVVKVEMKCQKCRIKALKIAVSLDGVKEVRLDGEEKDRMVVIGEGVDLILLNKSLRKKVGYAELLTLEEVNPALEEHHHHHHHYQQKSFSNPTCSLDQAFQPGHCCFM